MKWFEMIEMIEFYTPDEDSKNLYITNIPITVEAGESEINVRFKSSLLSAMYRNGYCYWQ